MDLRYASPTAIGKAARCLHTWYLECFGDRAKKRPPDAGTELLIRRGEENELRRVATLKDVARPQWNKSDWAMGVSATLDLMRAGCPWIYQGVLQHGRYRGLPDLLQCVDGSSSLGAFTYRPVDIKNHATVSVKDRFQLMAYAHLLEPVLGSRPTEGAIWLSTDALEAVDLPAYEKDFQDLLGQMDQVLQGKLVPAAYRCTECRGCPWIDDCRATWEATRHVSLLAGVSASVSRKLCQAGLSSWKDLVAAGEAGVARVVGAGKEAAARDIWLHAMAWETGKPQTRRPARFPSDLPIHFYDIETFNGSVYLHGDVRLHRDSREERQFFADDPADERRVWHEFLDWLARDRDALVYCWASYEVGFARSLWERHGGNPDGWKHLARSLRDQKEFVKEHFALPVTTYSIKEVAPAFGFHWTAVDAGGLNSESWYGDWLARRDPALKAKILRYNLDDVLAMEVIDRELRPLGVPS